MDSDTDTTKNIAWLSVNASYSHSSFALACVHAATPSSSLWQWAEVRATLKDSRWGIVKRLLECEPGVVAATVYLFNRDLIMSVIERFAALKPDCVIVLGGPEFLGDNKGFLETYTSVNAVFRGEADLAFGKFLKASENCRDWHAVEGLCWLDEEGRYHDNGTAIIADNLDILPSPITSEFYDTSKPFATLETSRGCPSQCAFCTSCRLGKPRYFSLLRVREDMQRLYAAGVKEVRILDRTFNLPSKRCLEVLDILAEYAGSMRFHLEVNPAALTDEVAEKIFVKPAENDHIHRRLGKHS